MSQDVNTGELKHKVAKSFFWVGLANVIQKLAGVISVMILARLLEPGDFGVVAIATTVIAFVGILGHLGIKDALIYQKKNVNEAANATFFLNIILGLVYTIATFILAPYLADFFRNQEAKAIIQVLSLQFILSYLGVTSFVILQKKIEFFKKSMIVVGTSLLTITVTLVLAYMGFGAWSLVFGNLTGITLSSILYLIFSPWKPTLKFRKETAKEIFHYSKHLIKSDIYITLIEQGDKFALGRIKDSVTLGYYTLAYNLANLPAVSIASLVQEVSFPVFSKIREQKDLLRNAYHKNIEFIALLAIPICLGFLTLAPEIITYFYGEKWLPMKTAFQILAFFGCFRAIAWIAHDIIKALGKPKIFARLFLLQLVLTAALIYPLTVKYSLTGTAISLTIPAFFQFVIALFYANKMLGERIVKTVRILAFASLPAIIMAAFILLSKWLLPISNIYMLLGNIVVAASVFAGLAILFNKHIIRDFKEVLAGFK
ncbi:lipopolysaccharide biosynthesis protein, partial [Patescibacteria group bacterium]|nr:lipopolysaccharide biosynthesis protein [Patescibacteria group bacterium]